MISIDDHQPPDPSSYDNRNHQQQVPHDLEIDRGENSPASVSDIDLLKPTDDSLDDTNNRLPNFSIRDYVFSSRCKDITCNWPFSSESLQLCLDSGVKNFLPPFQSLDSVRSNSFVISNEETVSGFDGKSKVDQLVSQRRVEENLAQKKPKKSHTSSSQPTTKKCKFTMKSNSGIEPLESFTPNNFILSETMASKVCPVCKTFSSSSNTTLNAHIDGCLFEESSMNWTANSKIIVKHRIKPRKTRLMVDIYKTAPRCTVEELDRRNGTSWANNSSFPDQEFEVQEEEEEKEKPQEPKTFIPEVVDHEGTVYIDTNGTKVRILSMPKVGTLDGHEALPKVGKVSKIVMEKKKKKAYVQKRCLKFMKLSPNSKKLSSLKTHHGASEARSGQEEKDGIERSCKKVDRGEKPVKHKQMDDLAITRPPWACSKRTVLAKMFNGKNGKNGVTNELLVESDKSSDRTSSSRRNKKARTQLSNVSKCSYLKTNLPSKTREQNSVTKFNLKRKFPAVKESQENARSSQDSLKQKPRMEEEEEEDTSKNSSFDMVTVPEVHKKNLVTSKSSDMDSLETARTEIPSHSNHVRGSFMGLKNPILDDEFLKIVSQPDKFDSRESMENIMIGHNIEDEIHDIEKQENYFEEVDPIPIPGPPGSFLPPSPGGDMVSNELQDNSSLTTTSRVQSNEHQSHHNHDIINRDFEFMSESPISTISNPSFTKKDPTLSAFQNDQPCCCSKKESVFLKNVASYPQEPVVLKRPSSMNLMSELFSRTTLPPPSETVKSPRDCESPVNNPSTPVLRLMGKNLTVVKTDDEQYRPQMSHRQLHNIKNDQNSFLYGYPTQHPIMFNNHIENGSKPQHFNVHPPNNSRNLADSSHIHAFDTMFTSTRNGFVAPADYRRLDTVVACDRNKEMINIDDSYENEADDSYTAGVSPVFHNGTFQTSSPLDRNLGRGGCNQTGSSSILHPNSFGTQSAFIPNIRSTSYYPRSFS